MKEMIEKIVEVDKQARVKTDEAKKLKNNSGNEIESRCREINKRHTESAKGVIETLRKQEEASTEEKWKSFSEKSDRIVEKLEKSHRENCDKWVNEIVGSIIGG